MINNSNAIYFEKYQGTGNDFIMIDNRLDLFDRNNVKLVKKWCDRKFGIGADGLILIENSSRYDFEMIYFNPDGSQSLCGNGSRCAVKFAHTLGIIKTETKFHTISGPLFAFLIGEMVHLQMPDVKNVSYLKKDIFINTGSPHLVQFVDSVETVDVYNLGKKIRFSKEFGSEGTNVNFVQQIDTGKLFVRTYERGVENETLSCGTGVTASALAAGLKLGKGPVDIICKGGDLKVDFESDGEGGFKNIFLIGPAEKVFEGTIKM